MNRQSDEGTDPAETMLGQRGIFGTDDARSVIVPTGVTMFVGRLVMMKTEEPLQQEHREKTPDGGEHHVMHRGS